MYNSAASSQYSNNPFIDDPTNSAGRFPDIGIIEQSTSGYTSPGPSGYGYQSANSSMGYPQPQPSGGYGIGIQAQPQPQQYLQPQLQQQQSYGTWQSQSPSSPYGGYGSSTGYGSNPMSPQMTGIPYQNSYSTPAPQQYPQQQQQQYSGYQSPQYSGSSYPGYAAQQGYAYGAQSQPSVSEFDPLKPQTTSYNPGLGPGGQTHPREFIRTHKQELEMWDSVSWKQALNTFETLRAVWESHKNQISSRLQQGGFYLGPVEGPRLEGLQRDAEHNIDTITASTVQMQEVLGGYRQSADFASKNRVRESLNAAITSLPDWPPQSW